MAKLQITDAQKTAIVDAVDQHLDDAFREGVSAPSSPSALPEMELYSTLTVDPVTGKDMKLGVRVVFRQVIAAIAKVLNIKQPLPNGFSGNVDVNTPTGTHTWTIQDGFVITTDSGTAGGAGATTFTVNCQSTDSVGDFVMATPGTGTTVKKATLSGIKTTPAIGVIISKPTGTSAVLQVTGVVNSFTGLTPGVRYFVGNNARPDASDPPSGVTAGTQFGLQCIGIALDSSSLLLIPTAQVTVKIA